MGLVFKSTQILHSMVLWGSMLNDEIRQKMSGEGRSEKKGKVEQRNRSNCKGYIF